MDEDEKMKQVTTEWQEASQRWVDELESTPRFWQVSNHHEFWTYITDNIDCTPPDATDVSQIEPITFREAMRIAPVLERLGHYVNIQIGDDFYESPEPEKEEQDEQA